MKGARRLRLATHNVSTLRPEEIGANASGEPLWGPTAEHFAKQWERKYDIVAIQEHRVQWQGVTDMGGYTIAMAPASSRGQLGCAILCKTSAWNIVRHEVA